MAQSSSTEGNLSEIDLNSDLNSETLNATALIREPTQGTSSCTATPTGVNSNSADAYVDDIDELDPSVAKFVRECRCVEADLFFEEESLNDYLQEPESVIKVILDTIDRIKAKYITAHDSLIDALGASSMISTKLAMARRHRFLSTHKVIKIKLLRGIKTDRVDTAGSSTRLRFPKIDLPEFSGNADQWIEWKRLYTSLVHNNNSLTAFEKHQVLRTKLRGEPQILLQNFPLEDKYYIKAWELLNSTYGDPVIGLSRFLDALGAAESINPRNPQKSLRSLITHYRSYVTAIQLTVNENPTVDILSQFVIHSFLKKTDESTRTDWEREVSRRKSYATFDEFIEFMDGRCSALERATVSVEKKAEKRSQTSGKVLAIPEKRRKIDKPAKCHYCAQDHKIFQCPTLLGKSAEDRLKAVKEKRLCFRCLKPINICKRRCTFFCKVCKKGHNPILHDSFQAKDDGNKSNLDSASSKSNPSHVILSDSISDISHVNNNLPSDSRLTGVTRKICQLINPFDDVKPVNNLVPDSNKSVNIVSITKPVRSNNSCLIDPMISGWVGTLAANNIYELLATVVVEVELQGNLGRFNVRALLDSCSQFNIISKSLLSRVRAKRGKSTHLVGGVGATSATSTETANFWIYSKCTNFKCEIKCIVLDDIVDEVPSRSFSVDNWKFPSNIQLADPKFNVPASVELLLGTGIFWNVLLSSYYNLGIEFPRFQQTKLGWIVTGNMNMHVCNIVSTSSTYCSVEIESLERISHIIERFWLLDETKCTDLSDEEKECEQHFLNTTTRHANGRFILRLPFKQNRSSLGHSKTQALKRFHALEKRFAREPEFHREYTNSIKEMISQGWLRKVDEFQNELSYYIPHHAVIKDTSVSTKLRIVLDPTMRASSGLSLNDCLMKGPVVQPDLVSILLRSRTYRFIFTADIKKMFLQFLRHPDDTCFQRILWRVNTSDPIFTYEFTVVPFGLKSSPFEATRALTRLAELEGDKFPEARSILLSDTYVDDIITGAASIDEVVKKKDQVISLLSIAGLELGKWCANSDSIIADLPPSVKYSDRPLHGGEELMIKTLGLCWYPKEDVYKVQANDIDPRVNYTKRKVLSIIASIYDPLGLLGPVTVLGKLIMQLLWSDHMDWDAVLPNQVKGLWLEFVSSLHDLKAISIPRYLFDLSNDYTFIELHGFADASEKAYGAVLYIRSVYPSHTVVRLLFSKSRVAPLKKQTLPRLELCAAELLANLTKKVLEILSNNMKFSTVRLWTDSEIALYWIRSPAEKWQPFVANRVRRIKDATKNHVWDHVSSKDNPADPLSRGIKPSILKNHALWWNGPSFLSADTNRIDSSSKFKFLNSVQVDLKRPVLKPKRTLTMVDNSWMSRFKSLHSLVTTYSYVCRFFWNAHWFGPKIYGPIRTYEHESTLSLLIKLVQREVFKDEFKRLENQKDFPKNSSIASLAPFLDGSGLIRVGGRLQNSNLSFEQRHPILLPSSHLLTKLIIREEHVRHLHAGPSHLKSVLRRKYWIIHSNKAVRFCITHCLRCNLAKKEVRTQLMAALPKSRVTPQRPFTITGVDYAGPVKLLLRKGRHKVITKAYIAVFVCFSVKAIHLELVSDLTSEAFIAAFNRFISRRGIPSEMHSDNGTTFVGTKRILTDLGKCLATNETVTSNFWRANGVKWYFIPPYAPHFGGLWEAGVKSVKNILSKVVGSSELFYEQYETVLCQIEACLNSRPLVPESNDPNDLNAITPGHFLIGGPITALPNPDLSEVPTNRLKYWQLTVQLTQRFWKRWHTEYLQTLQERFKWKFTKNNVNIGELVVIKDEATPPTQWLIGRIIQLHPGEDGLTRVVSVRTGGKVLKRAIGKLVFLPTDN